MVTGGYKLWFVVRMENGMPAEVVPWADRPPETDAVPPATGPCWHLVIAKDEMDAYLRALHGNVEK